MYNESFRSAERLARACQFHQLSPEDPTNSEISPDQVPASIIEVKFMEEETEISIGMSADFIGFTCLMMSDGKVIVVSPNFTEDGSIGIHVSPTMDSENALRYCLLQSYEWAAEFGNDVIRADIVSFLQDDNPMFADLTLGEIDKDDEDLEQSIEYYRRYNGIKLSFPIDDINHEIGRSVISMN